MSRGTFRRNFLCWLQIFHKVFRILTVFVKKIGSVAKTAFYASRRTFKIVFSKTSSVLFTPWLWTKLFRKVDKKNGKFGEIRLYVSRRTKCVKTSWKNCFSQLFAQLLLKVFEGGRNCILLVESASCVFYEVFEVKIFWKKILRPKTTHNFWALRLWTLAVFLQHAFQFAF